MRVLALAFVVFGCSSKGSDLELRVEGFDGAVLHSEGTWLRQRLAWAPGHPNEGQPEEVLHSFLLWPEAVDCSAVQATWEQDSILDTTGIVDRASCEAHRVAWAERSLDPWYSVGLSIEFTLWDTQGERGTAIAPVQGTFTPIDGPDADAIELAISTRNTLFNHPQVMADSLDCDAAAEGADPYRDAPDVGEAWSTDFVASGSVALDPGFNTVNAEIALAFEGSGVAGGSVAGAARYGGCDVVRVIEAPIPID